MFYVKGFGEIITSVPKYVGNPKKLARSPSSFLEKFCQLKQKLKMKEIAIKKTTVGVQQNCIFGNFFLLFFVKMKLGKRERGKLKSSRRAQHFLREV